MRTRFTSLFRFDFSFAVVSPLVLACGGAAVFFAPGARAASTASQTARLQPSLDQRVAPSLAGWNWKQDEDELEAAWTWAAPLEARGAFETRIAFHIQDAKNYLLLRVTGQPLAPNRRASNGATGRVALRFWRVVDGRVEKIGDPEATIDAFKLDAAKSDAAVAGDAAQANANKDKTTAIGDKTSAAIFGGQLAIQRSAWRVRALWNGRVVATAYNDFKGGHIGAATHGAARLGAIRIQPVAEAPFLRDDFMRAQGPDDPEVPGQWHRVSGVWKTSGLLGPRADAALNPNPFVFRAALSSRDAAKNMESNAGTPVVASVGRWFWSDYTVSTALRPTLQNPDAPLVGGVSALVPEGAPNSGVSGVVDFRQGQARITVDHRVVATSAHFDAQPNQWHRIFLDPGPGTLRLVVDGIERARANAHDVALALGGSRMSTHVAPMPAQGQTSLVASLGSANYVDFDDVRIGPNDAVSDDFTVASVGRWDDVAGEWQTVAGAPKGRRVKVSNGRAITLTGSGEREEGLIEADFAASNPTASNSGDAIQGVVFAARDASNYFVARKRGQALEIVEFAKGAGKILASQAAPSAANASSANVSAANASNDKGANAALSIAVEWRDGIITARSGKQTATATVSGVPSGRVGVWAQGAARMGGVSSFRALGAAPGWGEEILPERFTKDRLMKNWASNASLWLGDGATKWHTGDFFNDAALSLPLSLNASNQGLQLMLGASPDALDAGARLKIERAGDVVSFVLYENGKIVGQSSLDAARAIGALRFVRRPISAESVNLRVALGVQVLISVAAQTHAAKSGVVEAKTSTSPAMSTHAGVKVGVDASRAPALDWEKVTATTSGVMDYAFTGAPVDWRAGKGRWEVKERWTCSPQWGFFAGAASSNPTLWSRFATRGDWTLEAYIATPMDVTRGERGPTDLNISVGGDGRDLASGYSFLFSGDQSRVNRVFRGDAIALEKPLGTPPGDGNTHQNWFYIRLERRQNAKGLSFRYLVNGQEIWNYTDPSPLRDTRSGARHIAFWTQNGGLSIARVRLWHSGIEARDEDASENENATATRVALKNASTTVSKTSSATASATSSATASTALQGAPVLKNALGEWRGRSDGDELANLRVVKDGGHDALRIANPQSGGDWTLFATQSGFDAKEKPFLKFNYRVPESVFANIYARVDGKWREIVWTGDAARLGERLRNGNEQDFARTIASTGGAAPLAQIGGVAADDKWHSASFDLLSALQKAGLSTHVEALAFAAPDIAYLRAGIGGNHKGAAYYLSDFDASAGVASTALASIAK